MSRPQPPPHPTAIRAFLLARHSMQMLPAAPRGGREVVTQTNNSHRPPPPFSRTLSPSSKVMVSANEKSTEGIKLSAPPHPLHTAIRFLINLPATGQQRVQLRLGIIRPLLPALHTPACRSEPGFVTLARAILTSGAAGNQACHRQIAWLGAKRIAPDLWPDF